jgi:hypothetical protein
LVVASDILVKRTQHDHGNHTREEDDNDKGVHDANRKTDGCSAGGKRELNQPEPLDVAMGHGVQDVIPSRRPLDVILLLEADVVCVGDVNVIGDFAWDAHGLISIAVLLVLVLQTGGDQLSLHQTSSINGSVVSPISVRGIVIHDHNLDMVEHIVCVILIKPRLQ